MTDVLKGLILLYKQSLKASPLIYGEITYRAVIQNLSEGGVLINKINAFNKKDRRECKCACNGW